MKDSELDQLLRASIVPAPLPPSFQHDVWSRIQSHAAAPGLFRITMERFLGFFAVPSVAAATCAAMVVTGVWLGLNSQVSTPTGDVAYLQSISPFAHNHR